MRLTALNVRAGYALARIYTRFQLPNHEEQLRFALAAATEFARRAARNAGVTSAPPMCPIVFVDEPALVQAWEIGLLRFPGGWDGTGEYVPWWRDTPTVTALPPGALLPFTADLEMIKQ